MANSLFTITPPCTSSFSLSSSSSSPFLNFTTCCYRHTHSQPQLPDIDLQQLQKKPRKPKPSFYHQIRHNWSVKPTSHTTKFPWQLHQQPQLDEHEHEHEQTPPPSSLSESPTSKETEFIISAFEAPEFSHKPQIQQPNSGFGNNSAQTKSVSTSHSNRVKEMNVAEFGGGFINNVMPKGNNVEEKTAIARVQQDTLSNRMSHVKGMTTDRLPWMIQTTDSQDKQRKSKTELAEKLIPEHELKRLRNVALRMKERLKVGAAGVTQALLDTIHDKWKIDEVVKLKFEGPSAFHMKRIHQLLENKTGGLVIWRSGSSVVLFRGLTYKLDCVQSYKEDMKVNSDVSQHLGRLPDSLRLQKKVSEEESKEMRELNNMLDELGPRYVDWSGPPPLPVDADLLPAVVVRYRTPFRLLPYGVRRHLKDEETTRFRLAAAMVKLWEKSAIAKIAIKRGVLNTCNERMAEELKRLTGGTLLSRNKEYIVFYRGNDFLPQM
ncbi:CRM-domain containing factor CFM3 chloroplastic/mitochondrial [Bienertia sinuspersici]